MSESNEFILVDKATREPVNIGDRVETFRGEKAKVVRMRPPHKPSSSGHVTLKFDHDADNDWQQEYYATVIGAEYIRA